MDTRSRAAAVRAARAELVVALLGLAALALQMLASPKLRDARVRADMQGLVRELVIVCLRMAFRRGLKAGLALVSLLRGTAWADQAALVEQVASGLAGAEALPALEAPDATVISERLGRWMRGASRRAVVRVPVVRADESGRGALVRVVSYEGACATGRPEAPWPKNAAGRLCICTSISLHNRNV